MYPSIFFYFLLMLVPLLPVQAQDAAPIHEGYQFTTVVDLDETSVKSQDRTGTCWSYTTTSFLESEMIRQGGDPIDLSEMFIVWEIYMDKADNYIRRNGTAQFSQGGLAHDLLRAYASAGIVPQEVFDGLLPGEDVHDHTAMEKALTQLVEVYAEQVPLDLKWRHAVEGILETYMGELPVAFTWEGQKYTPETFAKEVVQIEAADYITLTSFTHQPMYSSFVLAIPDNYSNGLYYNVPLDTLIQVAEEALHDGYTIAWDGDVSERGFSAREGLAVVPAHPPTSDSDWTSVFNSPVEEMTVTPENRQLAFDRKLTTDDHLMHLTGIVEDQTGQHYFTVKNSWGTIGPYAGFLYMSYPYFAMKTVAITLHKAALPQQLREKLGI